MGHPLCLPVAQAERGTYNQVGMGAMRTIRLHPWEASPAEARRIQSDLADRVSRIRTAVPVEDCLDEVMPEESGPAGNKKIFPRNPGKLFLETAHDVVQVGFDHFYCAVHDREFPFLFISSRYCATVPNFIA